MPIQITAKRDGFRRCGMAHSDKTQTYTDGHFSSSVLAELMAEPMLVVSYVPDGQAENTDQSEALKQALGQIIELKDSMITLQARNLELESSLQQLSKDADALKSDNERANATIASLTPAPDTESKEPEGTNPAKKTK